MAELRELYQELIIDHGKQPRNFAVLADANYQKI
jgi:nitrogen fixation NifU-like protein